MWASLVASENRLLWLALAAGLFPSLGLILCVARGWTHAVDARLMRLLHRPVPQDGKPTRLTTAARDFTALGGDTLRILFLVACMIGLFADGRAPTAWQLLAIFGSARIALYLLKATARRPRPDPGAHGVVTYTTSFPSGHTFMAATLFVAAALLIPVGQLAAVQAVALGLALTVSLLVAATRLALGVHWPSDILVGWLGGVTWAVGWVLLIEYF